MLFRSKIGIRITFSVRLDRGYAHVFILFALAQSLFSIINGTAFVVRVKWNVNGSQFNKNDSTVHKNSQVLTVTADNVHVVITAS